MRRTFIEFAQVTRIFRDEHIPDEFIRDLQRNILQGAGDLVKGTGGIRKIRCAAPGRGRSGGIRVLFADYPETGKCLLLAAFAKNVKENLSKQEQNHLAQLKANLDQQMRMPTGVHHEQKNKKCVLRGN